METIASERDRGDACAQLTKRVCKLINDAGDELSSRAIHSNIHSTHLASLGDTFAGFCGESVADTFFVRMKT
jgi:hypothetical protein